MKQLTFLNSLCISEKEKGVRSGGKILKQTNLFTKIIYIFTFMKRQIHFKSKTRLYKIYRSVISRCTNEKAKDYKQYGGRGIKIFEPWNIDFLSFEKWAFENGYAEFLSIERKNVNGNYCPENCTWATIKVQSRNKRHTIRINGKTHGEILESYYPSYTSSNMVKFKQRLNYGWTLEEALKDLNKKGQSPKNNRKFSDNEINNIRENYRLLGNVLQISKLMRLPYSVVYNIVNRITYRHVN